MLRTRRELKEGATALGVRADVLERVDRLGEVLRRIDTREGLADRYALKGGTALNLFWLSPRHDRRVRGVRGLHLHAA